jgi:ribosome maturation factor RimP
MNENIKKIVEAEGLELYDVELFKENESAIYRVSVINRDGGVDIDTCAKISNLISPLLDLNPPSNGHYYLEVSSAGIERKIKNIHQFELSIGSDVEIKTKTKELIRAKIISVDGNNIILQRDDDINITLSFDNVSKAKTYFDWS